MMPRWRVLIWGARRGVPWRSLAPCMGRDLVEGNRSRRGQAATGLP